MTIPTELSIGEAARRTGVKVPTIRYYEQIGLLPPPPRSAGDRRQYNAQAIEQLAFIRHARELGFEIADIQELIGLASQPNASCARADAVARKHLQAVQQRIGSLEAMKSELTRMLAECAGGRAADCRVMAVLADHRQCRVHGREAEG